MQMAHSAQTPSAQGECVAGRVPPSHGNAGVMAFLPQVHPDLGGLPPIVPLLTVTQQRITGQVCLDPPVSPTKQVQDCCSRLHFLSCCVSFIQQMTVLTGTIPSSLKAKCTLLRSSTVKREIR